MGIVNLFRRALERYGAAKSTDLAKLDVTLTSLARLMRWGIDAEPDWVEGAETTAPAAGTALVSKTVSAGKTGKVFGVHVVADEGNDFQLGTFDGTTFTVRKRLPLGAKGTIFVVSGKPLINDVAAGLQVQVRNVAAGSAGVVYQASLLYAEV
ncbi:MAG: hypothetical protein QXR81_08950 [Candidatus Nezhaarchaeales archaeon]